VTVPDFGFGINPRAEQLTEAADDTHHVRGGNDDIIIKPVFRGNLGNQLFGTDKSAPAQSLRRLSDLGEYQNAFGAAGTMGQNDGTADLLVSMDYKCPSSGEEGSMLIENLSLLRRKDQLKFVVSDVRDMERAEKVLLRYHPDCSAIFTPVGGLTLGPVADFVLSHRLEVRVLPQLHKLIWARGAGSRRAMI